MAQHRFKIDSKDYQVNVGAREGNQVQVTVNGKAFKVELEGAAPVAAAATANTSALPAAAPAAPKPAAAPTGGGGELRSPMAGLVLSLKVQVGDSVSAGDQVLVLEAMKMENAIGAPVDGVIQSIDCQAQQSVAQGDLLLTIG